MTSTDQLQMLDDTAISGKNYYTQSQYGEIILRRDYRKFTATFFLEDGTFTTEDELPSKAFQKCVDWIEKHKQYQKDGVPYE